MTTRRLAAITIINFVFAAIAFAYLMTGTTPTTTPTVSAAQQFAADINASGLLTASGHMVALAGQVCAFQDTMTNTQIETSLVGSGYTPGQAAVIVTASVDNYCPTLPA